MQLTPDDVIVLEGIIEDLHALRPIQLGDGARILVRSCDKLRAWVAAAKAPPEPPPPPEPPAKRGKAAHEPSEPERVSRG